MRKSGRMGPLTGSLLTVFLCANTLSLISLKNLGHWSASPEVLSAARSTVRDFENVKAVLAGLSASLEETVKDIEKHICPFKLGKGLASIPDELLSEVFVHGLGSYGDDPTTSKETLSLVCRRFRRVVFNTPRLWSRINSGDNIPDVRTCLERSKSVGLTLVLDLNNDDDSDVGLERALAFLATVLPHSSRWEYLHLSFDATSLGWESRMMQLLSNLRLPSLHSLILMSSDELSDDIGHFYQSWEMPNLRSLEVDIIPKSFVAPKLSSVHLRQFEIGKDAAASERLRNFLTTFPDLEELSLDFCEDGAQGYPRDLLIDMPNLKTLSIESSDSALDVVPFMTALRAAKLRELEIIMSAAEIQPDELIFEYFLPLRQYPSLEILKVRLLDQLRELPLPFGKIPGLRKLSLDAPGFVAVPYDNFQGEVSYDLVAF